MLFGSVTDYADIVQHHIEEDDPVLEQQDAQELVNLFSGLDAEQIQAVTQACMQRFTPSEKAEFFNVMALGLSRYADDDARLAAVLKGVSGREADVGDFLQEVERSNGLAERPQLEAAFQSYIERDARSGLLLPDGRTVDVAFAQQRRREFIEHQLPTDQQADPARLAQLYKQDPPVMSRAGFDMHYRVYGDSALQIVNDTHLDNEIAFAMGWAPAAPIAPSATQQEALQRLGERDYFAGSLTPEQTALRDRIHRSMVEAAGGEGKPISFKVELAATGTAQAPDGVAFLQRFEVTQPQGPAKVVNHAGVLSEDIDAYLADPRWPPDMPITLRAPGALRLDANDSVSLQTVNPRHDFLHDPKRQKGAQAMVTGGSASSMTGIGAAVGLPMSLAGGAYLLAGMASDVHGREQRGETHDPRKNPELWIDYASMALTAGSMGLGAMGNTLRLARAVQTTGANERLFTAGAAMVHNGHFAVGGVALVNATAQGAQAVANLEQAPEGRKWSSLVVPGLQIVGAIVGVKGAMQAGGLRAGAQGSAGAGANASSNANSNASRAAGERLSAVPAMAPANRNSEVGLHAVNNNALQPQARSRVGYGGTHGTFMPTPGVSSRIKESPRLVREAEISGRSHQESLNRLVNQLCNGNKNPGIGTKPIGAGLSEARARDGARVYFREGGAGIEILGKSGKDNQDLVIKEVIRVFGN